MKFVGVDPDTTTTAFAVVDTMTKRVQFDLAIASKEVRLARDRMHTMAESILNRSWAYAGDAVAIEWQSIRPSDRRPDNIASVVAVAGMVLSAFVSWGAKIIYLPYPSEWKGTIPKEVHHPRILTPLGLTEDSEEFAHIPKSKRGHCIDALGLALWAQSKYNQDKAVELAMLEVRRARRQDD